MRPRRGKDPEVTEAIVNVVVTASTDAAVPLAIRSTYVGKNARMSLCRRAANSAAGRGTVRR